MSSNTTTEQLDDDYSPEGQHPAQEWAPSQIREDQPSVIRWLGMIGLMMAVLGAMMLFVKLSGRSNVLASVSLGCLLIEVGLVGMLFHAATDKEFQVRRSYGFLAFVLLAAGAMVGLFSLLQIKGMGGYFGLAVLLLSVALTFLAASLRHETDERWRNVATGVAGGCGVVLALTGLIGSNIRSGDFLLPHGLVLALLGLAYVWAFAGLRGMHTDIGYRAGLGIGLAGAVVFLAALGRSALPPLFYAWHWIGSAPAPYYKPVGFVLMLIGLLYMAVSAALCSDNRLIVLTRRELIAFFYSPIAYLVLFGLTLIAGFFFAQFINTALRAVVDRMGQAQPLIEPIVQRYMFSFFPVVCLIFVVPILTMRLLSEEQRTGTLEVLLTAPVNEITVVLSKFFAALLFLLLTWAPWGLLLIALRIDGGQPFDYRPLLSFFVALAFIGAGFMSMGLFFSSLTRNQIASAVLTFAGMLLFTGANMTKWELERSNPTSAWSVALGHVAYIDMWWDSLAGSVMPRMLVFFLSLAVLWLFLTVKTLEIRRWS
jgi:hypothetical protein